MTAVASASSAEKALKRMRGYTTGSFVAIVIVFALMGVFQVLADDYGPLATPVTVVALVVAAACASVVVYHWERAPAPAVELLGLAGCTAAWVATCLVRGTPGAALVVALAFGVVVARSRDRRPVKLVLSALALFGPVAVGAALFPDDNWTPWFIVTAISFVTAVGLSYFTIYTWGLYLQIDAARRGAGALAVAQERYRFAADLHDIQGHTLHVIRLKTQLARRLLDTDPAAAREHLLEAETLIGETLANTRSLAFGEREVALAAELANAQELFSAAGIRCTVTGDPATVRADELFGLTLRETTTNILRHSQAKRVDIEIAPDRLAITNDGSPESQRPPSGLGRLGERFEEAGGSLRTRAADGTFTTEAVLA